MLLIYLLIYLVCQTVTKSKHKLKDHMRAHTQEKLAACPTCGALFCNMSRLYDHLKRQVENEGYLYILVLFICMADGG